MCARPRRIARLIFIEPDLYDPARPFASEEPVMTDTDDTDDTGTAATLAAVDRFNDAFNRHDVDAVMAAMTDDCVFESTSPPLGERHEGADAVRARMAGLLRGVTDCALRR